MLSIISFTKKVKLPSLHFIFIFCFAILTICFRRLARGSQALSSVGFQRKLRKILEPEKPLNSGWDTYWKNFEYLEALSEK
jgi:hypothetical protein